MRVLFGGPRKLDRREFNNVPSKIASPNGSMERKAEQNHVMKVIDVMNF